MFSTNNIFLLWWIPSYTFAPPPDSNEKHISETEFDRKVQLKMGVFNKFANMIPNSRDKGEFMGQLKMIIRQAIEAEELWENRGLLKAEKKRSDVYRVLLRIGHRVNQLEQILSAGSDIVLGGDRDKRWIKILKLDTPIVKEFRYKIIKVRMDVNLFARNVQQICQERNDRARHGDVSLPEALQENNIHQILKLMKIPRNENTIITLRLLVSPLTLPSTTTPESKSK